MRKEMNENIDDTIEEKRKEKFLKHINNIDGKNEDFDYLIEYNDDEKEKINKPILKRKKENKKKKVVFRNEIMETKIVAFTEEEALSQIFYNLEVKIPKKIDQISIKINGDNIEGTILKIDFENEPEDYKINWILYKSIKEAKRISSFKEYKINLADVGYNIKAFVSFKYNNQIMILSDMTEVLISHEPKLNYLKLSNENTVGSYIKIKKDYFGGIEGTF
jgi:hypothetical protein